MSKNKNFRSEKNIFIHKQTTDQFSFEVKFGNLGQKAFKEGFESCLTFFKGSKIDFQKVLFLIFYYFGLFKFCFCPEFLEGPKNLV